MIVKGMEMKKLIIKSVVALMYITDAAAMDINPATPHESSIQSFHEESMRIEADVEKKLSRLPNRQYSELMGNLIKCEERICESLNDCKMFYTHINAERINNLVDLLCEEAQEYGQLVNLAYIQEEQQSRDKNIQELLDDETLSCFEFEKELEWQLVQARTDILLMERNVLMQVKESVTPYFSLNYFFHKIIKIPTSGICEISDCFRSKSIFYNIMYNYEDLIKFTLEDPLETQRKLSALKNIRKTLNSIVSDPYSKKAFCDMLDYGNSYYILQNCLLIFKSINTYKNRVDIVKSLRNNSGEHSLKNFLLMRLFNITDICIAADLNELIEGISHTGE